MTEGLTQAQIVERLQRMEQQIRKIAKETGIELDDPAADVDPEVVALAQGGNRMEAARLYSERTGTDFVEAQRIVNAL